MTRPVTKQASASCLHRRISYSKHWENFAPQFWMSATARNLGRGSSNDLGFSDPIMNAIRTLRACNWTRGLHTPVVYRAGYRKKTPTLYEPLCERRAIHWTRGYRLFPRFPEPEAMNVDKWIPGPSAGQEGDERYPDGLYQTGQQTRHANIVSPSPFIIALPRTIKSSIGRMAEIRKCTGAASMCGIQPRLYIFGGRPSDLFQLLGRPISRTHVNAARGRSVRSQEVQVVTRAIRQGPNSPGRFAHPLCLCADAGH